MSTYNLNTDVPYDQTEKELKHTLELWGAKEIAIWTEKPPRRNAYVDPTVHVSFLLAGQTVRLKYGQFQYKKDNIRALYLAIDRMRLIEKAGLTAIVREAFAQLPPPPQSAKSTPPPTPPQPDRKRTPYETLQVRDNADWEVIEAAYRRLVRKLHPDVGGDRWKFQEVQLAYEELKKKFDQEG